MSNIRIIGTSHIAKDSLKEITATFNSFEPDIIALELDVNRFRALVTDAKPSYDPRLIRQVGLKGYLFATIGSLLQRRLGDLVGTKPGAEMLHSANLAREHKKIIALIDRDLRITLKRLSKLTTFKEKMRLLLDIIRSPFSKKIEIDLSKVPPEKIVSGLITMMEKRYPGLYRALVAERNEFMASRILALCSAHPGKKILVVVGAGHLGGLRKLLAGKAI